MSFSLDTLLASESHPIGDLALCEVRLFDDARFPWLVLAPKKPSLVEIIDLSADERTTLMDDITDASRALKELTNCHKLNVAALGNQVRQLHIHVIARFEKDAAWPSPVWGKGARLPYAEQARNEFVKKLKDALGIA